MYALLMLALNALVVIFVVAVTNKVEQAVNYKLAQLDSLSVQITSDALRQRLLRTGSLGVVTLADLQSQDEGFETRGVSPRVQLISSTNVSDGVWQFDRALVYALSPDNTTFDPSLPASNTCDNTTAFATASTWCGPNDGIAYQLIETRENYLSTLTDEGMRMQTSLQKLARGYDTDNEIFPHGALAVGSAALLCNIGGASCAATACRGVIVLNDTPLDCADQFSRWGLPVTLNLITAKHIALSSAASGVRRTNSTNRNIARELRAP
ncbi:hypothetical protein [Pseudomonas aeruginosa]|uniref:hypothetical protein n=1 Tax=Pseudomonas aeruginosa TaxID=287 RepID=UPI00287FBFE6|nr:hypothetical protein [Pseudomonas aeruginosa]